MSANVGGLLISPTIPDIKLSDLPKHVRARVALPGSVQIANNKGTTSKHVGKKGAFSQRMCTEFAFSTEVVQEQV